jgi:hypothetical protein
VERPEPAAVAASASSARPQVSGSIPSWLDGLAPGLAPSSRHAASGRTTCLQTRRASTVSSRLRWLRGAQSVMAVADGVSVAVLVWGTPGAHFPSRRTTARGAPRAHLSLFIRASRIATAQATTRSPVNTMESIVASTPSSGDSGMQMFEASPADEPFA